MANFCVFILDFFTNEGFQNLSGSIFVFFWLKNSVIKKKIYEVKSQVEALILLITDSHTLSQLLEVVDTWEIVRLKAEIFLFKILTSLK